MQLWKLIPAALLAVAARPALANCGNCDKHDKHAGHDHHAQKAAVVPASDTSKAAAPSGKVEKGVRTVEMKVTQDGFVPAEVHAKQGETVKLAVTREVEKTCATEIVMKDFKVNEPLPLGKKVVVTVKPEKKGTYRFACGMDMIAGALVIE